MSWYTVGRTLEFSENECPENKRHRRTNVIGEQMSGEQMSSENKCPENKCHWRTNVRRTNVIGEQMSLAKREQMSENKCPRTNVIGEQIAWTLLTN